MHDKEPYSLRYLGNPANFEKYLPEFEKMVKSFRFVGSASSESGENLTNTTTNFSSANASEYENASSSENLTELYGDIKDGNYPEELYDECVNVAGKSFCDFLFKR